MPKTTLRRDTLPPGIQNAYLFQAFNTMSFSLVNGALLILYFKRLGASSTILGILGAMPPLLNILQIPAAYFVEKVGYRAFVLKGWSLRTIIILFLAGVVFLPDRISNVSKIALMLFFHFGYNALRGISVCGFLPWINRLVPESVMGRYLSFDQVSGGLAMIFTSLFTGLFLLTSHDIRSFGIVLLFSFFSALISLLFLKRIPDVPVPQNDLKEENTHWKDIIFYPPFFRFLLYSISVHLTLGASGAFWASYMRDIFHFSDTMIFMLIAGTVFCAVLASFGLIRIMDRTGSRPILFLSGTFFAIHFLSWLVLGFHGMEYNWITGSWLCLTAGIASASFNAANTRLAMSSVPTHGRSHFFAYFSVINNLALGIAPLAWGLILDHFHDFYYTYKSWTFSSYSILYTALALTPLISLILLRRVPEPKAMKTEDFFHELFIHTPGKVLTYLFPRRTFKG